MNHKTKKFKSHLPNNIKNLLFKLILKIVAKIFTSFDVEEGEVEDAVTYYIKLGCQDLKKISDDIRLMYSNFGG